MLFCYSTYNRAMWIPFLTLASTSNGTSFGIKNSLWVIWNVFCFTTFAFLAHFLFIWSCLLCSLLKDSKFLPTSWKNNFDQVILSTVSNNKYINGILHRINQEWLNAGSGCQGPIKTCGISPLNPGNTWRQTNLFVSPPAHSHNITGIFSLQMTGRHKYVCFQSYLVPTDLTFLRT